MKTDIATTPSLKSEQPIAKPRSFRSRLTGMLHGRKPLLVAGVAILGAGMVLNWGWLTAVGAAPIILALAPCALMCTVGICCIKGNNRQ